MSRKKDKTKNSLNVSMRENVTIAAPAVAIDTRRDGGAIPWFRQTYVLAAASSLLLWASYPPAGLSLLAWIAPFGWLRLVQQEKLLGKRPYLTIWFAGFVFWLALLFGVSKAHPILIFGWLALSAYLAVYIALFVGLTRVAVHRLKLPLMVAAPVIWVGFETIRSYFLTGFALALLGHTQARWPVVIQIADLFGAYTVSFFVMFVAACLATMWPSRDTAPVPTPAQAKLLPVNRWAALPLAFSILGVLGYGWMTIRGYQGEITRDSAGIKVAIIQESVDTIFEYNPERNAETFEKYRQLTLKTCRENPGVQLVVWPESMLSITAPAIIFDEKNIPPEFRDAVSAHALRFDNIAGRLLSEMQEAATSANPKSPPNIKLLAGCDARELNGMQERVLNSAILFDEKGRVLNRYAKMHLVMFGEYIPIFESFPWLYSYTPMPRGLDRGTRAECFDVNGVRVMPNVCFESTVPQLIRRQFNEVQPDLLVNVSNDGWFWGSSILDHHLACSIFRAVELRRPVLIAANTGISAAIDGTGEVSKELPRRTPGAIVCGMSSCLRRHSLYATLGDFPAGLCVCFTLAVGVIGMKLRVPLLARKQCEPVGGREF